MDSEDKVLTATVVGLDVWENLVNAKVRQLFAIWKRTMLEAQINERPMAAVVSQEHTQRLAARPVPQDWGRPGNWGRATPAPPNPLQEWVQRMLE